MFGLLSRKVKPPPELVRTTREAMLQLEQSSSGSEPPAKASEEVSRNLSSMKLLLYGEPDQRPNPEAASELAREVWKSDVLRLLRADHRHRLHGLRSRPLQCRRMSQRLDRHWFPTTHQSADFLSCGLLALGHHAHDNTRRHTYALSLPHAGAPHRMRAVEAL